MDGKSFSDFVRHQLSESRAQTVNSAFQKFLDDQINIAVGTRQRASKSQIHLREFLSQEFANDPYFPRVLSVEDGDFLGGSYARHVKLWPLDDIDVYVPLDGFRLVYSEAGIPQAATVLSDGVLDSNPLLDDPARWMIGPYISSSKLIAGFRKVLARHYTTARSVRSAGEAVRIQLTTGQTQAAAGLGFDVVPCFSLWSHGYQQQRFYLIPDGNDGWITTNPREDQTVSDRLQSTNNSVFRAGVKLVKWWVQERCDRVLTSYYTELSLMRALEQWNRSGGTLVSISQSTSLGFNAIRDAIRRGDQVSWVRGAPPVKRGDLDITAFQRIDRAAYDGYQAFVLEQRGNEEGAIDKWRSIFGDSFPSSI